MLFKLYFLKHNFPFFFEFFLVSFSKKKRVVSIYDLS